MLTTRRHFLAASAAAAAGLALGRPAFARALLAQPSPVFTPIRRNVGIFTMRGGTVGWLVNRDGVAVVDTQFPAEAEALLAGLNERSGSRPVDVLLNTHHHGDHTAGNPVFRGAARQVVAHERAAEHMRQPPGGGEPPADQLYPTATFAGAWSADVGDERIVARHHGRAHTSGDAVVTFERANVVHMGDLMFHHRHPVVDRAAGATLRGWMAVLEQAVREHDGDTVYVFGHAGPGLPVTGDRTALDGFRGYLGGLLAFVQEHVDADRTRDEILAMRDPLPGFESWGPFGRPGPRDPLTVAYEEVTSGG